MTKITNCVEYRIMTRSQRTQAKILEDYSEDLLRRPENWGGYKLLPDYIEFWQGRSNRLHDRLAFCLENNNWSLKRLAP